MENLADYNVPQDGSYPVRLVDSPFGPLAVMYTAHDRIWVCSAAARAENHAVVNRIPVVFNVWARKGRYPGAGQHIWSFEIGYARRMDARGSASDELTGNQQVKIYDWCRANIPAWADANKGDIYDVTLHSLQAKLGYAADEVAKATEKHREILGLIDYLKDHGVDSDLVAAMGEL